MRRQKFSQFQHPVLRIPTQFSRIPGVRDGVGVSSGLGVSCLSWFPFVNRGLDRYFSWFCGGFLGFCSLEPKILDFAEMFQFL